MKIGFATESYLFLRIQSIPVFTADFLRFYNIEQLQDSCKCLGHNFNWILSYLLLRIKSIPRIIQMIYLWVSIISDSRTQCQMYKCAISQSQNLTETLQWYFIRLCFNCLLFNTFPSKYPLISTIKFICWSFCIITVDLKAVFATGSQII